MGEERKPEEPTGGFDTSSELRQTEPQSSAEPRRPDREVLWGQPVWTAGRALAVVVIVLLVGLATYLFVSVL
jgi:hypothetical protein